MSLQDDVYGVTYNTALEKMRLLSNALKDNKTGFPDIDSLEKWAKDHLLDKVVFSNMSHKFMCVSHKGEIIEPNVFEQYYGNILYCALNTGNKITMQKWHPTGYDYFNNSYIIGEESDGLHRPLFYRDYNKPTGYYSEEKDAFNIARPFPVFAKETGRDTSHIYTYLQHISGECYMWLLAWLRMKMVAPTSKTQVVPIIVSRVQGSGKSSFAEVICKGLFGENNVIVSDQYDATARFNADYADALIVCQEEKEETDKKNPVNTLKSRATATTIRKESKGSDPIYQKSYTDFILTTNNDVPVKFDSNEDQRRFMVMEADGDFTRKTSELADEVFTKLYGFDANGNQVGVPFVKDHDLIAQFKHELFTRADIQNVKLREFPKTDAYSKCFDLPRTNESVEIESIMRAIAPFIKASLLAKSLVTECTYKGKHLKLEDIVPQIGAVQYMPEFKDKVDYVALCRPIVFSEMGTQKPYAHSVVEKCIYNCVHWLLADYGLSIIPDMSPLEGGFDNVIGRYASAPAAKFKLAYTTDEERDKVLKEDFEIQKKENDTDREYTAPSLEELKQTIKKDAKELAIKEIKKVVKAKPMDMKLPKSEVGKRLRVNKYFQVDENGCFETVNKMKIGVNTLKDKSKNVGALDTFLLESDTTTAIQEEYESNLAEKYENKNGEGATIEASVLYKDRLATALSVSMDLFNQGKVARIVYSGAKSYHLLVVVKDAPKNLDEYKWLHSYLATTLTNKLVFDSATCDPARLTRSPLTLPRKSEAYGLNVTGTQELIAENWKHVLDINWRSAYEQWLNRPLSRTEIKIGKQMYPVKKEYQNTLTDILNGKFWTSIAYNGQRQHFFFPCYRLLRSMGYSHDDIWKNIILPKLRYYIKPMEINYWATREKCALIQQIDSEFDEYNRQIEEVLQ